MDIDYFSNLPNEILGKIFNKIEFEQKYEITNVHNVSLKKQNKKLTIEYIENIINLMKVCKFFYLF